MVESWVNIDQIGSSNLLRIKKIKCPMDILIILVIFTVLTNKITIFQGPIEARYQDDGRIAAEIQRVVRHEIAHHFGIDDDRLRELGR